MNRPMQLHRLSGRPLIVDLFCCQGDASMGYHQAGFDVIGVDLEPQPRYPFTFIQADALRFLDDLLSTDLWIGDNPVREVVAVHASPPCQAYSKAHRIRSNDHDRLIAAVRDLLEQTGLPYVIENVEDARHELRNPVMLCASMFGRAPSSTAPGLDRHRWFETNWPLTVPLHPQHSWRTTKMGRPPQPGEAMHAVGNFSGVAIGRELMAMPWASRDGLREAIPPYYAAYIGDQLMTHLYSLEEAA